MQRAYALAPAEVEGQVVELALVLSERERYAEAIGLLAGAERRSPGRLTIVTTLARLLASSPDLAARDGRRALELATTVHAMRSSPADAETMALALAELGRCAEALDWMRRAASAAETANDAGELARLRAETPKYQASSCRAPGR
jgi:hypothetical protein